MLPVVVAYKLERITRQALPLVGGEVERASEYNIPSRYKRAERRLHVRRGHADQPCEVRQFAAAIVPQSSYLRTRRPGDTRLAAQYRQHDVFSRAIGQRPQPSQHSGVM